MKMFAAPALRIFVFIGLVGLALFDLRIAVVAQSSFSGQSKSAAVQKYQQHPRLLVTYGRQAMLAKGDMQAAQRFYQRALISNPYYIPAWLALSELRSDAGQPELAGRILDYADGLTQDVTRWRWDKAMLAYQLSRMDILARDLSWLLREDSVTGQTRQKAVKLAFSLWPEPEKLVDAMGTANIIPLFRQAVRAKNLAAAAYIWPLIDKIKPETQLVLPYINLLISSKDIQAAAHIWQVYFPSRTLLYNGSFSAPTLQGGFGWWIGKVNGTSAEPVSDKTGTTGLHLHFTGKVNVKYSHTRQSLALEPGQSYLLSGKFQSHDLSTDQRPFIEIIGLHCSMPPAATVMMPENQEWMPFTLEFTVPDQCNGVQIRIRRKASNNLDNKISGDVWLTDFALRRTEPQADS